MANYELMLIVNPSISEEERTTSLNNLKKLFEENSVTIEKEDVWWEKKLAYKINSSNKGFYILYDLELDWKNIKSITDWVNLNKDIWRHMFVKKEA